MLTLQKILHSQQTYFGIDVYACALGKITPHTVDMIRPVSLSLIDLGQTYLLDSVVLVHPLSYSGCLAMELLETQ